MEKYFYYEPQAQSSNASQDSGGYFFYWHRLSLLVDMILLMGIRHD
jgi:hypothetical protein